MKALQLSAADIVTLCKDLLALAAALGIVVDLTPGIKFQPVRWAIRKLGDLLNHDIKEKIDKIEKELEEHKLESQRYEILDFANSCMNHRKHTKEEFDHIIKVHDSYEGYITAHGMKNGQVKVAYEYIEKIYMRCIEKNSFLTGKEVEEK